MEGDRTTALLQDVLAGRITDGMRDERSGFDGHRHGAGITTTWAGEPEAEVRVEMAGARGDPTLGSVFFGPTRIFGRLMQMVGGEFETLERRGRSALHGCYFQMPGDADMMVLFANSLAQTVARYPSRRMLY